MKRLVLAKVVGSARQVLAIFVALLAIAGVGYLVSHKLSNPSHYAYGDCFHPAGIYHGPIQPGSGCRPPTRAVWQIPLAIVIGAGGLGAALLIAGGPRRPRHLTAYRPPA
ncbi:MAG TPA: hypothetical protein VFU33_13135 [Gaiellaceae bacterium]|nr:hypothetical protein [Gaiellaceae bacterium]